MDERTHTARRREPQGVCRTYRNDGAHAAREALGTGLVTSESNKLMGARELVIVGAGGHGSEILAYLEGMRQSETRLLGFIDDNKSRGPWLGSRILGGLVELAPLAENARPHVLNYITAFGDN